jgi:hypothetical protein
MIGAIADIFFFRSVIKGFVFAVVAMAWLNRLPYIYHTGPFMLFTEVAPFIPGEVVRWSYRTHWRNTLTASSLRVLPCNFVLQAIRTVDI